MNRKELEEAITTEWEALGRDTSKLKLTGKSDLDLEDALEKLRAIKIGFKNLFSPTGNHNLAIAILANVFGTDISNKPKKDE